MRDSIHLTHMVDYTTQKIPPTTKHQEMIYRMGAVEQGDSKLEQKKGIEATASMKGEGIILS